MSGVEKLLWNLEYMTDSELRQTVFTLDGRGPEPGNAYPHQIEGLRRIELGADSVPPVSGIVHFPTGAGKTRVGLELAARALKANNRHRFVWATARKQLIRQTMGKMVELSQLFPAGTTFTWAQGAGEVAETEMAHHVVFMTRDTLTKVLGQAGDGRRTNHPWRQHLEARHPLTLIYDECHQLGADQLQQSWRKFYDAVVAPSRAWRRPWRTIGLSATPVPTSLAAHRLLGECVFPRRQDAQSTHAEWPFHMFHKVRNERLVASGVLCPINPWFDEAGEFDLPTKLLERVIGDARVPPPGANAAKADLQRYAMQFNSGVLAHPDVIDFAAQKLGRNINALGKTIVFVPNITAANRMAATLYERFPDLRGRVAAVHSRMEELRVPGQDATSVHGVLERFKALEAQPSVLVNVEMLTEGFDDPMIQTVMLARLTLSTNRFWQMIGRGTRGPAAKGTTICNVIDPIKLVRLYGYFSGYQPSFSQRDDIELEDDEEKSGQDRIPPHVPMVRLPPDPGRTPYKIDPELERVHRQVAVALRHFLTGQPIAEDDAVAAACAAVVGLADGQPVLQPAPDVAFHHTTAAALLLGELSILEARAGMELGWFRQQIPGEITETLLRQQLRKLRAVQALELWTHDKYAEAEMTGEFLRLMQEEARGGGVLDVASPPSVRSQLVLTANEEAVADAAIAVAAADGTITEPELAVAAEMLRRIFGRAVDDALIAGLRSRAVPSALPVDQLKTGLSLATRQLLVLQLAELAAADGIVSDSERKVIVDLANSVGVVPAILDAVFGPDTSAVPPRAMPATAPLDVPDKACSTCGVRLPGWAAFCMACGTNVVGVAAGQACAQCSSVIPPTAAYCTGCGVRVAR